MGSLMHQVISSALYIFFFLGVLAGQNLSIYTNDSPIEEHNTASIIARLALNFPFYFCAKYMLLIGWIKLAEDLQNPFGEDIYDLNLPVILDYEVWKTSYMLTQSTTPYDDQEQDDENDMTKEDDNYWDGFSGSANMNKL